jgi:hypothetical protein
LNPRLLLDPHIAVRWLAAPRKLSREQTRVLRDAVRRNEPIAISAITLLEIAVLFSEGRARSDIAADELPKEFDSNPAFSDHPSHGGCGGDRRIASGSRRAGNCGDGARAEIEACHFESAHHRLELVPVVA